MKKLIVLGLINLLFFQLFPMEKNNLGEGITNLVTTLELLQSLLPPVPPTKQPSVPFKVDTTSIAEQLETQSKLSGISSTQKAALSATIAQILTSIPQPTQEQVDSIITTINDFAEGVIGTNDLNNTLHALAPGISQGLVDAVAKELKGKEKVEEPEEPIIKAPINWNLYIPLLDSSFSKDFTVRYPSRKIGTEINKMRQVLNAVSIVRKGQAYNYTNRETIETQIHEITDNLVAALKSAKPLDPATVITTDQIDNFISLLFSMLEVAPLEPFYDINKPLAEQNRPQSEKILYNIIQLFSLINFDKIPNLNAEEKNNYTPGRILSLLSNGFAGSAVLSLQKAIDQERLETLKVKASGRTAHLQILAQKFNQALSRIDVLINLYQELTQDPYNLSLLDQDLFFFNIICNWYSIENMYTALATILSEKEYNEFLQQQVFATNPTMKLNDYFTQVKTEIKKAIDNHPRPVISQFDILEQFNDRIQQGQTPENLKLPRFILQYIPQEKPFTLQSGKINETIITSLWNNSLYQRFIACNNAQLKDQEGFGTAIKTLIQTIGTKPQFSNLIPLLNNLQKSIKTYAVNVKEREALDTLLTELSNNPEIASDTTKIDEKIKTIQTMDLTVEEKEDITATLEQRKEVIEQGKKLAEDLNKALCFTCQAGNEIELQKQIDQFFTQEEARYKNIVLAGTVLTKKEDIQNAQKIILEAIIGNFMTEIYNNNICVPCGFIAAWILANQAISDFNSNNPYVHRIIDFYNYLERKDPRTDPTVESLIITLDDFQDFFKAYFTQK